MIKQLALGVTLNDDATFANFYAGSNLMAVASLQALSEKTSAEQFMYLWGEQGVGRTHLLQACCHATDTRRFRCLYLPMEEHRQLTTDVLVGLENLDLICIDNIDLVLGNPVWEEALLHFYNRARDNQARLIVVADAPPAQLTKCQLQDLRSRLSWGPVFHIEPLSDAQKILALQMRAANRGLRLSEEVGRYLITHFPRDMHQLFLGLERLDQASLSEKRKLTIPFVKKVLSTSATKECH